MYVQEYEEPVESTDGGRAHVTGEHDCWCRPEAEEVDTDGILYVHKQVMLTYDTQPRVTLWGQPGSIPV